MQADTQYLISAESEAPSATQPLPFLNAQEISKAKVIKMGVDAKKQICNEIWTNLEGNLQDILLKYPLCEEVGLSVKEMDNLKGCKLIKGEHRIYFGQIIKTKKEGKGISIYSDGRIYEGNHRNNERSGLGYQLYNNGNVYIGMFDRNKKHGRGVFYWLNLEQTGVIEYYSGEWWDGLPSGNGRHQRCNGDLYEGQFKNGLKHGEGREYFNNGDVYTGQYTNGLPEGHGEYIWSNKSNYKGEFKQGLRYGFGCWKKDESDTCESYRGHYVLDLKSGHGIYSWPDGKFYKGEFSNDKKQGFGELYHNDILRYRGNWLDGKPSDDTPNQTMDEIKRLRSQSGSSFNYRSTNNTSNINNNIINNINNNNHTNTSFNQFKNTQRGATFRARTKSRQPTIESTNSMVKEIKLKRPSTVAPFDLRQLQKNSVYGVKGAGDLDARTEVLSNRCGFKCGHKNCIPTYPWERKKSGVKP